MMQRLRDDRGAALIMVVLLGFVSMVLVGTGLTVAASGLRQAVSSQRSTSALDAAFAGVQDYLARVNTDDTYVKYGNKAAKFTKDSGSVATVTTDTSNPAFAVDSGAGATWAFVPGSGQVAKFRYEVDNSAYKATGVVRLRATGASGERTRSLLASLRVRGFVDFSYFTDLEMQDPQISGAPDSCAVRYVSRPKTGCGEPIRFYPDDAISGDVHSNDRMIICAATFTGKITTYYTGSPLYGTEGCSTTKAISNIAHADELTVPSTNGSMKEDAACLYAGPTQVVYKPNGQMNVISPWTRTTTDAARCGTVKDLQSPDGATVQQLDQDLLYVRTVPNTAGDPNYWSASEKPASVRCIDVNGALTDATNGIGWSVNDVSTKTSADKVELRYPLNGEAPATIIFNTPQPQWNTLLPAYGCRNGDLYVKGAVTAQTTAASENYVYAIGDVLYADRTTDLLGLVGQNGVLVWNPMSVSADQPMLADTGREIDAAIISVAHTFQAQNYDRGSTRGTLKVYGSIAQRFRGPVSAFDPDTGYDKSYEYDPLLKTVNPPKFLASGSTIFKVLYYAAVPAGFTSTGTQS